MRSDLEREVPSTERTEQAACLVDSRGQIAWVNEAWRRTAAAHSGSPFANGEGCNYLEVCRAAAGYCAEAGRMAAELDRLLRGHLASFEVEYSCPDSDDRRIGIARVSAITLAGRPCAFVTHEDITALRRSEQGLRASEERYRSCFEAAPDAAFVIAADGDDTGRILDVNDLACRMHGLRREEMLARRIGDLDVPGDAARVAERLAALRQDGSAQFEATHVHADGTTFPVAVSARIAVVAGRRVAVSFNRDLRRPRAVEHALRDQGMRLDLAVRAGFVGFWDWDLRTDAVYFSPEWKAQIGYAPHEIVDCFAEWQTRVHPDDLPTALDAVARHRSGATPFYATEFRLRHRDGSYRWIYARGQIEHDDAGAALRMVGCHVDVTGQKEAERERSQLAMRRSQLQRLEAIGTLAGGIAHDFNNILSIISGNVELAELDPQMGPDAREAVEEIRRAGERAHSLVRQILAFSRDGAPFRRSIAPTAVLAEAERLLRSTIPRSVAITSEAAADLPAIAADPDQLHQALVNLGTNAWHALGDRPGNIHLAVRGGNDTVEFVVADDGCGMSDEVRQRIFEPFFTTKNAGQGTGLGLSVVHGIVEGHGGSIEVTSAPAAGTTFVIRLPAQAEVTPNAQPAARATGACRHVLLVDDQTQVLQTLRRGLTLRGHRVAAHTRAEDALAALACDAGIDVLVTDLDMPELSGIELARRAHELRPELPIVLTSGYLTPSTQVQLRDAGIVQVVPKPATLGELATAIDNVTADAPG